MSGLRRIAACILCVVAAGCQTTAGPSPRSAVEVEEEVPAAGWRAGIQPADLARLDTADAAWTEALDGLLRVGQARRIRAEAPLLDRAVRLPRATPTPGSYRCRIYRLETQPTRRRPWRVLGPYFCYVGVEGAMLSFTQQTGPQRIGGYLYPDDDSALIFTGASFTAAQGTPPAYGDDPARNRVGRLERIDYFRFRLTVPRPAPGVALEIYDLVPAV